MLLLLLHKVLEEDWKACKCAPPVCSVQVDSRFDFYQTEKEKIKTMPTHDSQLTTHNSKMSFTERCESRDKYSRFVIH